MFGRALGLILLTALGAPDFLGSFSCLSTSGEMRPGQADVRILDPAVASARELTSSEVHLYQTALTAGQYISLVITQRGIDVAVRVYGPDHLQLIDVDNANTSLETEKLFLIAQSTGDYRIEIRPAETDLTSGSYEIRINELRTATPQDSIRVAAEIESSEAQTLRRQSSADSLRKAITKFDKARELWRQVNNRAEEARSLISMGDIHASLANNQEALDLYARALTIEREIGDRKGEAIALTATGAVYYSIGDKQKAMECFELALPLHLAEGNSQGESQTVSNMGLVQWSMGDYAKALEQCEHALKESRKIGDRSGEANALYISGLVNNSLGENAKALDDYGAALAVQRAIGDRQGLATTLLLTGLVYGSTTDHQKALDYYDQALAINRDIGNRRGEGQTLNYLGQVYYTLGEYQTALDYYEQSLLIRRDAGDRAGEGITLNNIGTVYRVTGDTQKALDYYNQSLQLRIAVNDLNGQSITLSNIGSVFRLLGDSRKALEYYNRVLEIQRTVGNRLVESNTLNSVGQIYGFLGDDKKALDAYTQSLRLEQAIEDGTGEPATRINIAMVQRHLGNLSEALAQAEAAVNVVESLRARIASRELRTSFFAANHNVYEVYIDLLMHTSGSAPSHEQVVAGFLASERARSRILLDTLSEAEVDIRQGADPQLLEKERGLQREVNRQAGLFTRLLNGKHTEYQQETARKQLDAALLEYERVETQIRMKSPRYAALTQPRTPTLRQIQEMLDAKSLLLEYSLGDERSYLWAVTQNSIRSFVLPGRAVIEGAARRAYDLVTEHNKLVKGETPQQTAERIGRAQVESSAAASELSQIVLGPVAPLLGSNRLVIVSDGALQYISFAALPVPRISTSNGSPVVSTNSERLNNDVPLLIGDHEIINSPSASVSALLRQEFTARRPAAKTVAVIADPVYTSEDPRVEIGRAQTKSMASGGAVSYLNRIPRTRDIDRSANETGLGSFRRLRFSREEADAITALVPATSKLEALDFQASRETAISEELNQYRILHFSTHGLLNSQHPELSGLVFSLLDEQGQPRDGFLRIHDIFNLKLNADLVVLSACQTALGKQIRGEGLVGLTRGFMYAGSPRVVASLWKVDDRATAELMKLFYRAMLLDGLRPAAALRVAQIGLSKQKGWEAPYYWAAFTLQGEWR